MLSKFLPSRTSMILKAGHPMLRLKSKPVTIEDLQSDHFKKVVEKMRNVFQSPFGSLVGLSAPQIGYPIRLIAFRITDKKLLKDLKLVKDPTVEQELTFLANPSIKIKDLDESKWVGEYEACESVPGYNMIVKRAKTVSVDAFDLQGDKLKLEAKGFLARVIQHEVDHLNGISIVDRQVPGSMRHDSYIDKYDFKPTTMTKL